MIEELSGFPKEVLAFACKGHVTRSDYETILIPRVERALKERKKLRLYYELAHDFAGIDPTAVLADFRIGVEHLSRWERIAVVTDVAWIRSAMTVFRFLIPGETEIFPVSEAAKARKWIAVA